MMKGLHCWGIEVIDIRPIICAYCEKKALYVVKSWFGLGDKRVVCEKHKLEFIKYQERGCKRGKV